MRIDGSCFIMDNVYPKMIFFLIFNNFLIVPCSSVGFMASTESLNTPSSAGKADTNAMAIKHTNKAYLN